LVGAKSRKPGGTPNRELGLLTAPQVRERLSADSVLCLPVGSYEQHGPHLPLNTDSLMAEGYARDVVKRWGDLHDLWLLPTIPYGISPEHAWSPGTVSLPLRVYSDLLMTMCEGLTDATPARNLLVINGHGGNRGILEALVYEIEAKTKFNVCVTHPSSLSKVKSTSPLPEVHGGMKETSVMLWFSPGDVHMESIPSSYDPKPEMRHAIESNVLGRGITWPWTSDDPSIAMLGIIGDARNAGAEFGHRVVTSAVEEYGRVIARLKS
jgi:creatinine amidohydrolase